MNIGPEFRRRISEGKAPALTDEKAFKGQKIICEEGHNGFPTIWVTVLSQKDDVWAYRIHWFRPDFMGKQTGTVHHPSFAFDRRDKNGFEPERTDGQTVTDMAQENKYRFVRHLLEADNA